MSNQPKRTRRLIEEWLPIAELSEESIRERRSMTALPPTYYLHVWFARRPLVASRAAILASLLPAGADQTACLHVLGIHGDPLEAKRLIDSARLSGERIENPYDYGRAFKYLPSAAEILSIQDNSCLDPTAGGGSIPFEAARLGLTTIANDLNPVAALILKATVELPIRHGTRLLTRFNELSSKLTARYKKLVEVFYPGCPNPGGTDQTYLWARTVTCPYCGGVVPLSPNWKLSGNWTGAKLVPETCSGGRRIRFEIVYRASDHGSATVKDGTGLCPFPDCGRTIDGDEIKSQAQAGQMGHQLYAVVFKEEVEVRGKNGKLRKKMQRGFRAPLPQDDVEALVASKLREKMPEWQARNIIPDERFPEDSNDTRPIQYGAPLWRDLFSARQLFGHCTSVEVFHDLVAELEAQNRGRLAELDRAALVYLAFALDKMLNYNAIQVRWHSNREVVAGVFDRHDFSFKWSYAEMEPTITGIGFDWAIEQTGKALRELIELVGVDESCGASPLFSSPRKQPSVVILNESGDGLSIPDASVDCVVTDPPYYDNVMYAELADFFYVWLKRTAGLLYPDLFMSYLTDKDREAVANPAKFTGQKGGAKNLAGRDYQQRMAAIFKEQRRVLKPDGIMTVMFTHKAKGAWDALASGLIDAGFVITASWPVHTEAEGSLHIREKAAAKSTIFLVCRVREEQDSDAEPRYWEEVEPLVAKRVREKVASFQEVGMGGVDLYLACFGPALEVFSNEWPLTRGRARQQPVQRQRTMFDEDFDPYAVRPEDALEAARREVKNWRLEQLATVKRQHHLDALTEWYMMAWDTFRAAKFDADEALKLARVIGLDFDQQVKNVVCDLKGDDVTLWDSKTRQAKGKLGHAGDEVMLDTLHWAAVTAREQNTGAAKSLIERANLIDDPTLKTALEAILKVLPQRGSSATLAGFAADFAALEKLRQLAYEGEVPPPPQQIELGLEDSSDDDE